MRGRDDRVEMLYSGMRRPSIPREMLLWATLLQAFFSARSERQVMEQIDYNLLFRGHVGLPMHAAVCYATVFTHNRDRLMAALGCRRGLAATASATSTRRSVRTKPMPRTAIPMRAEYTSQ